MSATNPTSLTEAPSWRLQGKVRPMQPQERPTPAAQSAGLFDSGNFLKWTDVPKMPMQDSYISDQTRYGKRTTASGLTAPFSSPMPEPFIGGRKQIQAHHGVPAGYGKRAFPELVGQRSTDEGRVRGLKRVESSARSDVPATSDPNSAVKGYFKGVESVKMFPGTNRADYRCWLPEELGKAEKGDWNWNQQLGFRKVNLNASGEPRRGLENPVAWPNYKGYPPTFQAGTGTRLDYALKMHGANQGFTLKVQHPDVVESRRNRASASQMPPQVPTHYRKGIY